MVKITKPIQTRSHGEGEDAAKVAANATALLSSYGYTPEDLATLSTADEAAIGNLFQSRFNTIEQEVVARNSKAISSKAELAGKKYAYENAEQRLAATYKELGIDLDEAELAALPEKTRLEGIASLAATKLKAATMPANTPEEVKLLQSKLQSTLEGQTAAQKLAKQKAEELETLKASIPALREQLEMEYFANQSWEAVAFKKDMLESLTVDDTGVLKHMINGFMGSRGHKFASEKQADGTFRLSVVDKEGNYIPMADAVGNHTPESYIGAIYKPIIKKSNAGGASGGSTGGMSIRYTDEQLAKLDPNMRKAIADMQAQNQKK